MGFLGVDWTGQDAVKKNMQRARNEVRPYNEAGQSAIANLQGLLVGGPQGNPFAQAASNQFQVVDDDLANAFAARGLNMSGARVAARERAGAQLGLDALSRYANIAQGLYSGGLAAGGQMAGLYGQQAGASERAGGFLGALGNIAAAIPAAQDIGKQVGKWF